MTIENLGTYFNIETGDFVTVFKNDDNKIKIFKSKETLAEIYKFCNFLNIEVKNNNNEVFIDSNEFELYLKDKLSEKEYIEYIEKKELNEF